MTSLETSPISATSESSHEDVSGGDACVFASGSAATAAMVYWVSLQREEGGAGGDGKGGGGHILAINDVVSGHGETWLIKVRWHGEVPLPR